MPLMGFIDPNWDINIVHKYPNRVNEIHNPVLFGGGGRARSVRRCRAWNARRRDTPDASGRLASFSMANAEV